LFRNVIQFYSVNFWKFFGLYIAFLFLGLGSFPLIDWDENIYGAIAKSMHTTGEYLQIKINSQIFPEKPPVFFWVASFFYKLFAMNEITTRIPSVLSGLVSFVAIYTFGKKFFSEEFGLNWTLVYSASMIPLFLSRTAYIDHIFNTFIFLSVVGFILYDLVPKEKSSTRIGWVVFTSITMGLAVLTKGPLGIAIPVVAFLGMRIYKRNFKIIFVDLLISLIVLLIVVSSFYLTNYYFYGDEFLNGFISFQNKLLTKSLESHTGPWFYHFMISPIGFFPWAPILFLYCFSFFRRGLSSVTAKEFSVAFGVWILFVLVIFSIVQTKLPHYSSSIYYGLSFFTIFLILHKSEDLAVHKLLHKSFFSVLVFGILMGGIFFVFPFVFPTIAKSSIFLKTYGNISPDLFFSTGWIPGLLLVLGFVLSFFAYKKSSYEQTRFISGIWLSMMLFFSSFSVFFAPSLVHTLQNKTMVVFDEARKQDCKIVFYKFLSFYPMFYREEPISIIGSYKFKEETELLINKQEKTLCVITHPKNFVELQILYPKKKYEPVLSEGDLILYLTKNLERP